jgi:hypothetical protein
MCAGLADLFPDDFRDQHAEELVAAQSIIVLRIPNFTAIYDKFIVLITSSENGEEIAAVCINTNRSPKNEHVIISQADYSFLDYDSHIDCSTIIPFNKQWLKELLRNQPERYLGQVSDGLHIDILLKISQSDIITDEARERFNL